MAGVVRLSDFCSGHIGALPRPNISASPNVFCNGIAVHRIGDIWGLHGSPPHGGTTITGSSNVFANNHAIARIGDVISCGSTCAHGSSNVFAN